MSKKNKKHKKKIDKLMAIPKDDSEKISDEITKLEKRKGSVEKGWKGILQRALINKQINERRKYLNTKRNIKGIKQTTNLIRERIELEKAREELKQVRDRNKVNFDPFINQSNQKQLRIEDLY